MSRYDDHRSSTGTLDSRDRYERYSRGPRVAERPRREDERFEFRLREEDQYGPPARAAGRRYEDDHLSHPSGPLVAHDRRRRDESPSFAPPRLVRRQSSLDTFDRIPRRKLDTFDHHDRSRELPRMYDHGPSPGRYREREVYEDIRIAEPDLYGDEEYREFRSRRRSSSGARHREEKPYPRKGKTRIPRKWVHVHAILDLGYPYREEEDTIVIQKALSKEQIDEVISLSKEFRRPAQRVETEYIHVPRSPVRAFPRERVTREHLVVDDYSPHREAYLVEASPRSPRDVEIIERDRLRVQPISRARSVSLHTHGRHSSPVRVVQPRGYLGERAISRPRHSGDLIVMRPRNSEHEIHDLEDELRLLRAERMGGIEITRQRDTDIIDDKGNEEEVTEIRRQERSQPNSRMMRAMMATLT
ncbi:hypothetical protein N7462_011209 [Penicillium macrosclerotiorum]|uniref:uncharacterized protein n=1 Tax=Penicillium macrosclerotiorum TaxID=303699 RepID=UPI002546A1DF|nr:uncharacterized protein N7462_011209 [Penicillium macrosclerotiorum]KAJ5666800.1 hypothetical protein N7462_011209 [Penicillium macrosclerotiorum]